MPENQDPGEWLVEANRSWRQRAESEKIRADSAEQRAHREQRRAVSARSSARYWRHMAVIAWAWLLALLAQESWHWSRWTAVPVVGVATLLNGVVDWWLNWRRQKQRKAAIR